MKKELVKFGFVVFAAVAMAACGGAKEETTETPAETPATTEPATTEPATTEPAPTDSTMEACDAPAEGEATH
ncbi:MAG: hypothetical protein IPM74_10140 [Crocinitomicaceae bacterium]|nr:hypothetical protein [Crocinitomicaceae bacterium]MBK8926252.1 hypothetical protein [Crocinitomicaceae bacterium]